MCALPDTDVKVRLTSLAFGFHVTLRTQAFLLSPGELLPLKDSIRLKAIPPPHVSRGRN